MSHAPYRLFIAYSRKDDPYLQQLRTHLAPLERAGQLQVWYDGLIEAGSNWENAIKANLAAADLILLLVSPDSLASDYFYGREVSQALDRHRRGEARVAPLILRPCIWQRTPLGELQALPRDGRPVSAWTDPDEAYHDATERILGLLDNLAAERRQQALATAASLRHEQAQAEAEQHAREQARRRQEAAAERARRKAQKADQRRALLPTWDLSSLGPVKPILFRALAVAVALLLVGWGAFKVAASWGGSPTGNTTTAIQDTLALVGDTLGAVSAEGQNPTAVDQNQTFAERQRALREAASERPASQTKPTAPASTPATASKQPAVRESLPSTKTPTPTANMVRITGGTFQMGDTFGEGESDEKPVDSVTLGDFYLGRYEVTFAEYDAFCTAKGRTKPTDEGWGRGQRPAINVSWLDAVAYCNWRSEQEGLTPVYTINGANVTANWNANGYRLPTEAEWEYAARGGGQQVRFGDGRDVADPARINFNASASYKKDYSVVGEYRGRTVPVGSLNAPNALGLHDMSGNVWEWCWDWYEAYPPGAQTNPRGPGSGSARVLRGGSWGNVPASVRAANRSFFSPGSQDFDLGFRLARAVR